MTRAKSASDGPLQLLSNERSRGYYSSCIWDWRSTVHGHLFWLRHGILLQATPLAVLYAAFTLFSRHLHEHSITTRLKGRRRVRSITTLMINHHTNFLHYGGLLHSSCLAACMHNLRPSANISRGCLFLQLMARFFLLFSGLFYDSCCPIPRGKVFFRFHQLTLWY